MADKKQNPADVRTDAMMAHVADCRAKLSADLPLPDDDACRAAIRGCLNSRTGRLRASAPPVKKFPRDTGAHLLWTLLRFHRGNGSLWGYPHFADKVERDQMDTLAIILCGGQSTAADAWSRALGK